MSKGKMTGERSESRESNIVNLRDNVGDLFSKKFAYRSLDIPLKAAKRLKRELASEKIHVSLSRAKTLIANLAGYPGWGALTSSINEASTDLLDHQLSPAKFAARRLLQTQRLSYLLNSNIDTEFLISRVEPTDLAKGVMRTINKSVYFDFQYHRELKHAGDAVLSLGDRFLRSKKPSVVAYLLAQIPDTLKIRQIDRVSVEIVEESSGIGCEYSREAFLLYDHPNKRHHGYADMPKIIREGKPVFVTAECSVEAYDQLLDDVYHDAYAEWNNDSLTQHHTDEELTPLEQFKRDIARPGLHAMACLIALDIMQTLSVCYQCSQNVQYAKTILHNYDGNNLSEQLVLSLVAEAFHNVLAIDKEINTALKKNGGVGWIAIEEAIPSLLDIELTLNRNYKSKEMTLEKFNTDVTRKMMEFELKKVAEQFESMQRVQEYFSRLKRGQRQE